MWNVRNGTVDDRTGCIYRAGGGLCGYGSGSHGRRFLYSKFSGRQLCSGLFSARKSFQEIFLGEALAIPDASGLGCDGLYVRARSETSRLPGLKIARNASSGRLLTFGGGINKPASRGSGACLVERTVDRFEDLGAPFFGLRESLISNGHC